MARTASRRCRSTNCTSLRLPWHAGAALARLCPAPIGEAVFGRLLPASNGAIPGPASKSLVDRLARYECPAITARRARRAEQLAAAHDDPIVWARAAGANVEDADGNIFVDMTAGFGVMSVGYANPAVVAAGRE